MKSKPTWRARLSASTWKTPSRWNTASRCSPSAPGRRSSAARPAPMFNKILIANRGEIALRVINACKELGAKTVAVYSEADRHTLPVSFAEVCEASGITFIGPGAGLIRLMGEKDRARREMAAAGLPVLPGSDGVVRTEEEAKAAAARIGYPVMVKAVAGGGGRGMRVVGSEAELPALLAAAQHEAGQTFGCADVYVEKFIARPRHIEFQVLGDKHGNLTHLGERDCSIQRRHQKLLEESPSPAVSQEGRE